MEITIQALLEGKSTLVKDKTYLETKEYVNDFLIKMKKLNAKFIVNVELPKQITITDNSKDITFNKVWIQAIIPNNDLEYNECCGLIYALDIKTPIYKLYRGYINKENNNLYIFDNHWIITRELDAKKPLIVDIDNLLSLSYDIENRIKNIKSIFISSEKDKQHRLLGGLIERTIVFVYKDIVGKIKLSPNDIIKSFEDVYYNTTSPYYVKDTEECSLYNYYNSICNQITNGKDIINRCEKTILIGMLLNLIKYNE